jgi:two-component system CheB/CheR fusion protein
VTSFFRDAAVFQRLVRSVIPKLFNQAAENNSIRVWVPGCVIGEEVNSIAMLVLEEAGPPR